MPYVRKYKAPRDSDEFFDADEIMHILKGIQDYEKREEFKKEVLIAIPLAIIVIFILVRFGE